jgi:hypothetical protein
MPSKRYLDLKLTCVKHRLIVDRWDNNRVLAVTQEVFALYVGRGEMEQ